MTSFQGNETALHQLTADCMLDTTDVLLISCLLIGLATYFLLAAFMLDTKIGRYFISIAETIDLCRPGSTIAIVVSTARRMIKSVASYLSRKKPEGAIVPGVHPVLDFLRSEETAPSCASPIRSPQRSCSAQCTSRTFERSEKRWPKETPPPAFNLIVHEQQPVAAETVETVEPRWRRWRRWSRWTRW